VCHRKDAGHVNEKFKTSKQLETKIKHKNEYD
jgi:hypothetical protein